ncbi:Oxysterol-binding protein-domain-containing protein [Aspergillus cavernicola]|uniref:Oxysterol-binding protein-domain-containing protein n=1 Tax=Aspergillus cavernicola TaxID=176166 RepID=A0ABR4I6Y2_9EURO
MAAMEELEVHSKSYFVRWVPVKSDHTISWSIQPHKKSLNFGIFKHPGQSGVLSTPHLSSSNTPNNDSNENLANGGGSSSRQNTSTSLIDKLTAMGLKQIRWVGKCEADKIVQGTYDVPSNEGGNYALVFDNTFSKQVSKTLTLVLLTYPTALPPQSVPTAHAANQPTSAGEGGESTLSRRRGNSLIARMPPQIQIQEGDTIHTGLLLKRRRKRHQGWARRFFSLDFTTSTLSYFHDPNSTTLRGSIPLTLAAVACNEKSREISIDSGTEVWHLRARTESEFASWKRVLEKASSSKNAADDDHGHSQRHLHPDTALRLPAQRYLTNAAEEREWVQVANLVSRVSGSRDAVRRLAKDTDPKYIGPSPPSRGRSEQPGQSPSPHPAETNGDEKRSFWKRKTSNPASKLTTPSDASFDRKQSGTASSDQASETHESLMALLRDLDQVVSEFSTLITESQQRRQPPEFSVQSRVSVESDRSDEFFDAVDGGDSPLLTIKGDSDEEDTITDASPEGTADDAPSDSDDDASEPRASMGGAHDQYSPLFPARPKSLSPLPLNTVSRRNNIPPPTVMPPSLIGFLRKNVGKDLSQISMPVSSNEPLSLLQRAAEIMEYSALLDRAAQLTDANERLLHVTAFALSSLSSSRVRERAIRKPFNPMLGETYELIREDMGFRFIAEKVSHRPVQLAYQADSKDWSLTQSPCPSQKFWGKSAEIVTDGKLRITIHSTAEHFSWSPSTSFLRNIIAGEKYVEPVGELTILNETTGHRTISSFKAGGMFSGRSEDVSTKLLDPSGREPSPPLGLSGTWTSSLNITRNNSSTGPSIWTAGPLVHNAPKHYGLTTFAAALNEITPIEATKIPPTDSRLRPDQRALEDGDVDRAEEVKVQLEEAQRARRRELESSGELWEARWFTRVDETPDGEAVWRLKNGKEGYWEERSRGSWSSVPVVFES